MGAIKGTKYKIKEENIKKLETYLKKINKTKTKNKKK